MSDEAQVPQDLPQGEPVAAPEQNASASGTEQPASPPETEQPAPEEPERRQHSPYERRLYRQSAKIAEQAKQIGYLQAQLEGAQPKEPTQAEKPNAPDQQAIRRQVEDQLRFEQWDTAGQKASPTFRNDCAALADLGAGDNPFALKLLTSIDDSPAIVARLAADPAEAERIFALPDARMAYELAKFAARPPAPPPVSKAPPPIKPVTGSARVETDPDKMTTAEWKAWREKQLARS